MEQIRIDMLGGFSIRTADAEISDRDNRSKKVWLLLACLICRKNQPLSSKDLISLLWGDDPASDNPENTLKITFHRARTLLSSLWPSAGRDLIVRKDGGFCWNSDISMTLDTEEFERLCSVRSEDSETQLRAGLDALALYRGEFLPKLSSETWIIPIAAYYHNLYVRTALSTAALLFTAKRYDECAAICRSAIAAEPYHEPFYQQLMQAHIARGDRKAAVAVYEELSERLFHDFGIKPSHESKAIYREAAHYLQDQAMPMDAVLEALQETDARAGALECDYDYFRILCHAEARSMLRSGKAAHIVLLSVSGEAAPLSKRSLDIVMKNLGEQIRLNLRRGDAFSRCSTSQFVILLPQANYENSCMVSRRVIGAFQRRYPHSPAKLLFMVQPLSSESL